MLFTVDSHLEKVISMQCCPFYRLFTQWIRRKIVFHVTSSNFRIEQVRRHPKRRFPLLGTGFVRRTKWAGVMVIGPESLSMTSVPPICVANKR